MIKSLVLFQISTLLAARIDPLDFILNSLFNFPSISFFFDFGNVFSDNCKDYQINCYKPSIDDLRYSYGVGITWITGFGPMSFAISKPTNAGQYEETKEFQFTVGNVF